MGCGNAPQVAPGDPELRASILENLGKKVILPELSRFEDAAEDLRAAIEEATNSPDAPPEEAREAFASAMERWQLLEMMQIGPLAPMSRGGQDYRDEIYSWPVRNNCRVDQALAKGEYTDDALADDTINARGLDALEYLLFTEGLDNSCASTIDINEDGSWAALSEQDIRQGRLDYSLALAELLVETAGDARAAYHPDGGDFVGELASAGEKDSVYASSQEAFNDWAEALFYLDLQVKDMKVGEPAAIQDCPISQCLVELPAAKLSKRAIVQNLQSFDLQFFGGNRPDDGPGLDDLLIDLEQRKLAEKMAELLDQAHSSANALPDPLGEGLEEGTAEVQETYDAIKAVTDLFETEIFSVLSLELPDSGASDSD
jgi:predicted lipoprotein